MINISANIAGHALMLQSPVALPTGSIAVDQLELAQVVGEEWAACATVTAQFWIKPSEIYEAEFENNVAVIPQEVLSGVGLLHIAVYGSDAAGTKRISTNTVTMPITQGSFTEASAPAPSASLFEQAVAAALAGAIAQSGHYTKPANGIPETDLASDVRLKLARANSAQPMLTAGAGINIDNNNVISATGSGGGLSNDAKQALLALLKRVAYIDDDGQNYLNALTAALDSSITLTGITAVFDQGNVVIYEGDSLDELKPYLTVTALYSDNTSVVVDGYSLNGTLTVGTSTITVTYNGKSATFNVTVTAASWITGYTSVGTPTIENNVLTPSANGYIKIPQTFNPSTAAWSIRTKVIAGATGSYQNVIRAIDNNNSGKKAVLLQRTGVDSYKAYISSDDANYNIMNAQSLSITQNAPTYIEISFDGSNAYSVKTSEDGIIWNTAVSATSTSIIRGGDYIAFGGPNSGIDPFDGKIYLADTKIYVDGQLWWKAV